MVRLSAESRYAGFSGHNGRRSSLGRSDVERAVRRQEELAADARVTVAEKAVSVPGGRFELGYGRVIALR